MTTGGIRTGDQMYQSSAVPSPPSGAKPLADRLSPGQIPTYHHRGARLYLLEVGSIADRSIGLASPAFLLRSDLVSVHGLATYEAV
jgi:hypothetical protein